MKKSLLSLAFGGFGLGMTEFVMMGILPDIAKELNITISEAAHFIFAYAMGVGGGALLLILSSRIKFPKHILLLYLPCSILCLLWLTVTCGCRLFVFLPGFLLGYISVWAWLLLCV